MAGRSRQTVHEAPSEQWSSRTDHSRQTVHEAPSERWSTTAVAASRRTLHERPSIPSIPSLPPERPSIKERPSILKPSLPLLPLNADAPITEEEHHEVAEEEHHDDAPDSGTFLGEPSLMTNPQSRGSDRSSARPNTSSSSARGGSRWRGETTPRPNLPDMWRPPGALYHDDEYNRDPLKEQREERELQTGKRLAGEFLVSGIVPSLTPSTELPPPMHSWSPPTHSPYMEAWRAGVPPVGRWILERGRPRWIPEQPSSSLSQKSVEAWFSGSYREFGEGCSRLGQSQEESSWVPGQLAMQSRTSACNAALGLHSAGAASPTPISAGAGEEKRRSSGSSTGSARANKDLSTGAAPACPDETHTFIGRQSRHSVIRMSVDQSNSSKSRKSKQRKSKLGRLSVVHAEDEIEDINEILLPLESMQEDEDAETLARFEWVPRSPVAPSQQARHFSITSAASSRTASGRESVFSLQGFDPDATRSSVAAMPPGRHGSTSMPSQTHRHGSTVSQASIFSGKRHGSTVSQVQRHGSTVSQVQRHGSTMSSFGHLRHMSTMSPASEHDGRRKERDQRSEIKKLQSTLLSSGQTAFEPEVWESCGIEAEHLKRHQFAALIGGMGLFKIGPKDDLDDLEVLDDAAQSEQPFLTPTAIKK